MPNIKHGYTKTGKISRTYSAWSAMLQRCYNINNPNYKNYGGRGIEVCTEWKIFENFLANMGIVSKGLILDRINNDENYHAANCRWVDRGTSNCNRRFDDTGIRKTSPKDDLEIIHLRSIGHLMHEIATRFNVSEGTIRNILRGKYRYPKEKEVKLEAKNK